jgi:hypothetical protein
MLRHADVWRVGDISEVLGRWQAPVSSRSRSAANLAARDVSADLERTVDDG